MGRGALFYKTINSAGLFCLFFPGSGCGFGINNYDFVILIAPTFSFVFALS